MSEQEGREVFGGRRRFLRVCTGVAVMAAARCAPAAGSGAAISAGGGAMKKAVCHYSFHRRYAAEKWTPDRLAREVKALGIEGIDYHSRFLGTMDGMAEQVTAAVAGHGLVLSSLSLSTNFNRPKADDLKAEIETTRQWIRFAAKVKAPVSRVFGGGLGAADKKDDASRKAAWQRMLDGLAAVTKEAEACGLVLGLENHGGLPCTAEEQIDAIKTIGSPALRATVDVGNYMQGDEEGHVATALVAPYAAYVHFKDNKREGGKIVPCVLGEGVVNLAACIEALKKAGYKGFVGLEYEGTEDEATGVPKSVEALKRLVK
jgi:sugar phosphate isomerase/epimerase